MKFWTVAAAAAALGLAACSQPAETPPPPAAEVTVEAPSGEYEVDVNHTTITARARTVSGKPRLVTRAPATKPSSIRNSVTSVS